jgi:glycosyltransferase involved in cell wall biosynthesis
MPNAMLEAMACERVVVASDAGGIPEAIDSGHNGFLVPKALLNHLGQAVVDVLSLSEERKAAIGAAARARIEERFQAQAEAAALQRVLDRTIPKASS